jgi:hypothetical protein
MQAPEHVQDVQAASTVVVYEPDSGTIVHVHHCVTSHGGQHPSEPALAEAALAYASHGKAGTAKMSVLHVDPSTFHMDAHYRVDPQKRALVEMQKRTTE